MVVFARGANLDSNLVVPKTGVEPFQRGLKLNLGGRMINNGAENKGKRGLLCIFK